MGILTSLFGKSPFGALIEHTKKVHECVELIQPLIEAMLRNEFDKLEGHHNRIAKLEHEADVIKTEIRRGLGKSYFLPVNRSDLLHFLHTQDEIADAAEDIAVLCTMRDTRIPEVMHEDVLNYVRSAIQMSEQLLRAAESMNDLVESAFGGPEAEKVLMEVDALNRLEWEVDKSARRLLRKMFTIEDQISPIDILLCMKIFKEVGKLANHAENTGEDLALMILRK